MGFVVAWWRPRNPLGWIMVGLALAVEISEAAIAVILIGLAILLFPDGKVASPRMRGVLCLYLALAVTWTASAYVITADAVVRHDIRVDSGGNLLALDNGASSPGWWNVLQTVVFVTMALSWLATLAGQAASYRRSSGERRLQLKWLLGGYDIDRIVSRTLAYAIVTGLLVGVYAALVLLATQVLRFHSSVAVAVSTLVAAWTRCTRTWPR